MFTLTSEQSNVVNELLAFLVNPDEREIAVTGPPGSGKSVILSHLIRNINVYTDMATLTGQKPYNKIYVTASTNKAVAVLKEYIPYFLTTETGTLCSFLGGKVINDFKTGNTNVVFATSKHREMVAKVAYSIVCVDEAYNLSREQITYLRSVAGEHTKIIFVGDRYQAPPVRESKSILLQSPLKTLELFEVNRTKNEGLSNLITQLRNCVQNKAPINVTANGTSIKYLEQDEFELALSDLKNADNNYQVLAYDNNTVSLYSEYISNLMDQTEHLQEGTKYIVTRPGKGNYMSVDSHVTLNKIVRKDTVSWGDYTLNVTVGQLTGKNINSTVTIADNIEDIAAILYTLKKNKEWLAYFYFHDNIVQLSKGYVTTLHKAQGSTYKRVYVDLDSLGSCTSLSTGLSLLYVAFSRPSHELILYGNLPKRFGTIS